MLNKNMTVNKALAGFTKVLNDLSKVARHQSEEAQRLSTEIAEREDARDNATSEMVRAEKILANLKKVIGED